MTCLNQEYQRALNPGMQLLLKLFMQARVFYLCKKEYKNKKYESEKRVYLCKKEYKKDDSEI